jgi:predicted Ser/Thr protein kinase
MKKHKFIYDRIFKYIKKRGGDNFKMMNNTLAMELKSFETDFILFQNKKEDFRKDFLNKFVAIKRGEIIASGNSIEEVNKILEGRNIDPAKTVIEFVPEEEGVMVL